MLRNPYKAVINIIRNLFDVLHNLIYHIFKTVCQLWFNFDTPLETGHDRQLSLQRLWPLPQDEWHPKAFNKSINFFPPLLLQKPTRGNGLLQLRNHNNNSLAKDQGE